MYLGFKATVGTKASIEYDDIAFWSGLVAENTINQIFEVILLFIP